MTIIRGSDLTLIPKGYYPKPVNLGNAVSGTNFQKSINAQQNIAPQTRQDPENSLFSPNLTNQKITNAARHRAMTSEMIQKLSKLDGSGAAIALIKNQAISRAYIQMQQNLAIIA